MSLKDGLLATLVMVIWGANFVVIDVGLAGVPPLVFVALRFSVVLCALPFVPRPKAPLRHVLVVGTFMSLGQFALLYSAMAAGLAPGLASVLMQSMPIFTIVLAVVLLAERPVVSQLCGLALGVVGLVLVGVSRGGQGSWLGFGLCLLAALFWGVGNVLVRLLRVPGGLSLAVWSSLVVPVPLMALAVILNGPAAVGASLAGLTWVNWASTVYTAVLASLVGYGIWGKLLHRYPASTVAPFGLLVPPIGLLAAYLSRGEQQSLPVLIGAALLVAGVAVASFGPRRSPTSGRGGTGEAAPELSDELREVVTATASRPSS